MKTFSGWLLSSELPSWAAVVCGSALTLGCSELTHASDFQTREPEPDTRACMECPDQPGLRHVPCPPDHRDTAEQQVRVFALRAIDFGARASGWNGNYKVGLDRDCSDRPDHRPVACIPRNPNATWEYLSQGVDNAFATQVLYPLVKFTTMSPQVYVNKSLEDGRGGVLLIVDHWNGRPNDPQVGVRLLPSKKVDGEGEYPKPAWNGHDMWIAYADRWDPNYPGQKVPDAENKSSKGYVRNGVLVWDARDLPFRVTLQVGQAVLDLRLASVLFSAKITKEQTPMVLYDGVLSGLWSSFYASRSARMLAEAFAGCNMCMAEQLVPIVEQSVRDAPDMLLPTSTNESVCDSISFGVLGNYEEVGGVADIVSPGTLPNSCEGVAPCEN